MKFILGENILAVWNRKTGLNRQSKVMKTVISEKNTSNGRRVSYCPSCDGLIQLFAKPKLGQKLTCKSCHTELEIVELHPLTIDWAFDYEDTADDPYSDYDDDNFEFDTAPTNRF